MRTLSGSFHGTDGPPDGIRHAHRATTGKSVIFHDPLPPSRDGRVPIANNENFIRGVNLVNLADWWYGIVGFSIPVMVVYLVAMCHITLVSVTIYLHRHSAHRALDLHPAAKHFFRFWLWLTTGMSTKVWTAVHRKHHALTETRDDPHSPQIHGLAPIVFRGAEYYRDAITEETLEKYGRGTPDDWLEQKLYGPHAILGIGTLAVFDVFLFGTIGATVWALQMMCIPFLAAGVVNGVGHYWGYRNFECPDAARNIVPWGILICGEELHNNHHTYPNSAKLSVKPWEFDMGWAWIRVLQTFGLAKPLYTGPKVTRAAGKTSIDMDTTWAVLNDRFRVMSRYAEEVVAPLVKQERKHADALTRRLLRHSKRILCRHDTLVNERQRRRITEVVGASPILKTIYEKRLELAELWSEKGRGTELLEGFRTWCAEAEETGIQVLSDFVRDLKSYTTPTPVRAHVSDN